MHIVCSFYDPSKQKVPLIIYPIIGLFITYLGHYIIPNILFNKIDDIDRRSKDKSAELSNKCVEYWDWCKKKREKIKEINTLKNINGFGSECFDKIKELVNRDIDFIEMSDITQIILQIHELTKDFKT